MIQDKHAVDCGGAMMHAYMFVWFGIQSGCHYKSISQYSYNFKINHHRNLFGFQVSDFSLNT